MLYQLYFLFINSKIDSVDEKIFTLEIKMNFNNFREIEYLLIFLNINSKLIISFCEKKLSKLQFNNKLKIF